MRFSFRLAAATVGFAFVAAVVPTAAARAVAPDRTDVYGAGQACTFPLQIESFGSQPITNMIPGSPGGARVLSAGSGADLLLTNMSNNKTLFLKGNGSVQWQRTDAHGTTTFTTTGHTVNIYFPTDVPAGPSTTLVVGREVIAVDLVTFQFNQVSRTGQLTDLCAALR